MSDYLIDKYNEKISAALKSKEHAISQATQLWHRACEDIEAEWQSHATAAHLELTIALEHRNRLYTNGHGSAAEPERPREIEHQQQEQSEEPAYDEQP